VTQTVLVVGHTEAIGLEFVGACDVLQMANVWSAENGRDRAYQVELASLEGGPLPLWGGVAVVQTSSLHDVGGQLDTLVVVGGQHAARASDDEGFVAEVRRVAAQARRVVGLCTGAFILAAAGLLEGRRVTTHWQFGELLASRQPELTVDTDPIYVRDGEVWTSAGVTASFDLLLAVIEQDHGADAARFAARALVLYLRRTGNQAQFSAQLAAQLADHHPLRELQQFIDEHPEADLCLAALSRRANLSPRHLSRLFRAETGASPGRYVEQVRIETARRRLEEAEVAVEKIALDCGFGSTETMRRVFVHTLGISPTEYRRRFGPSRRALRRVG
jgi:transcriptional regulator GlxA family with amidase domain